uniref:Uncharacterized protein n=1 Tax=Oryza meridionalis TaxID=40149 RepID=A0A0E0DPL2_9ORYZ
MRRSKGRHPVSSDTIQATRTRREWRKRSEEVVCSARKSQEVRARSMVPRESKSVEHVQHSAVCGSSSGATGKLAAHTHFIEHILSALDFLNVLYCDQTNKVFNWHTFFSFGLK